MADSVQLELAGPVAVVTLDRAPLNIFDLAMRDDLIEALTAVREVDALRAMILAANGRHFSAGADLAEFGTAESIHEARRIRWDRDPWSLLWDLPIPTIAALHGVTMGSGLEMALLCDFRVAGRDVRLALPETKLGMLPAAGGTQSLTTLIGPDAATPLVALADEIAPEQALQLGVISHLVDDPDARARDLADELAEAAPVAVRGMKRCLRAGLELPLEAGLALERRVGRLGRS